MSIASTFRTVRQQVERGAIRLASPTAVARAPRERQTSTVIDARYRVIGDRPGIARHRQLPRWEWDDERDW